jgi:hypothetical protein
MGYIQSVFVEFSLAMSIKGSNRTIFAIASEGEKFNVEKWSQQITLYKHQISLSKFYSPDSEFQPKLIILASEQDIFGETKS